MPSNPFNLYDLLLCRATTLCDRADYLVYGDSTGVNCLNGGTCTESETTVSCECLPEFTGDQCEFVIDDCIKEDLPRRVSGNSAELSCGDEQAVCVDLERSEFNVLNFTCSCGENYQEVEVFDFTDPESFECVEIPCVLTDNCENKGVCSVNQDDRFDFVCDCPANFFGKTCNEVYDDCSDSPCDPNATCTNKPRMVMNDPAFICQCNNDFRTNNLIGADLVCTPVSCKHAETNPCENGSECYETADLTPACTCSVEFYHTSPEEPFCQENFDDCLFEYDLRNNNTATSLENNPCGEHGSCRDLTRTGNDIKYECTCDTGFHLGSGEELKGREYNLINIPYGETTATCDGFLLQISPTG